MSHDSYEARRERWSSRRAHFELKQMLEEQYNLLRRIKRKVWKMSAEFDRLTQEVAETKTVADSIVALVEGLAEQLRDIANDPAAIKALADELDATQAKMAAAVEANTPTPPAPPVEPPVEPIPPVTPIPDEEA